MKNYVEESNPTVAHSGERESSAQWRIRPTFRIAMLTCEVPQITRGSGNLTKCWKIISMNLKPNNVHSCDLEYDFDGLHVEVTRK